MQNIYFCEVVQLAIANPRFGGSRPGPSLLSVPSQDKWEGLCQGGHRAKHPCQIKYVIHCRGPEVGPVKNLLRCINVTWNYTSVKEKIWLIHFVIAENNPVLNTLCVAKACQPRPSIIVYQSYTLVWPCWATSCVTWHRTLTFPVEFIVPSMMASCPVSEALMHTSPHRHWRQTEKKLGEQWCAGKLWEVCRVTKPWKNSRRLKIKQHWEYWEG